MANTATSIRWRFPKTKRELVWAAKEEARSVNILVNLIVEEWLNKRNKTKEA